MIPEFMLLNKPSTIAKGKIIRVWDSKDNENIEATKAKKLKQVHEFLVGIKQNENRYFQKNE